MFIAFATSGPVGLMTVIIKILSTLITVLGAVFSLMGLIHYASANSEGDGPAKQKAVMQLASGIMLIALSTVLSASAESLANTWKTWADL